VSELKFILSDITKGNLIGDDGTKELVQVLLNHTLLKELLLIGKNHNGRTVYDDILDMTVIVIVTVMAMTMTIMMNNYFRYSIGRRRSKVDRRSHQNQHIHPHY